jgi:hypothetical protein
MHFIGHGLEGYRMGIQWLMDEKPTTTEIKRGAE